MSKKMTGITIFYGDNIIRYVVNIKKGLRPYFKQLPDNYQAKFELNLMSKFSNFIMEGANKQVISSQADSLIKISRIWADF
ncbi:hypothetical protein, partial [Escherichia coli]|uniref:hypothetical protein n=1 Tax=Escherichia coli TaxID=562 RepID=UPI004067F8B6